MDDEERMLVQAEQLPSFGWSWPEFGYNVFQFAAEATHCLGMLYHEIAVSFGKMHNRNVDRNDVRGFADSVMSSIAGIDEE